MGDGVGLEMVRLEVEEIKELPEKRAHWKDEPTL